MYLFIYILMRKDWTDANIKQINSMRNNLLKGLPL